MKRFSACFAFALLVLAPAVLAQGPPPVPPLPNGYCTIDAVPAATLLLPYFEVDIDDPSGVDTFFSVNNARNYSVLTHVIVWTDMSVEALDFNIYLTGYDVQTVGLGLIIRDGILPVTYYDDDFSPAGPYSDGHVGYPSCDSYMPYVNPALDAEFLAHLQSILTGGPSSIYGGLCGGYDFGDNIARGYVTVDVMQDCTLLTPCDPGYFVVTPGVDPDDLIGDWDNAIWGDWYMIDYANNFAQGDTLVHVQAAFDPRQIVPQLELPASPAGGPAPAGFEVLFTSFWGRCATYLDTFRASLDLREPLASTFATRFYQNAAFSGGTDLLVWRDSLFNVSFGDEDGFSCSSGPDWFPLNERQVVFFDEEENPEEICTISPCPEEDILFPIEAQRVSVGDLDVSPESGWIYMNLNQVWSIPVHGPTVLAAQAWVTAVHSADGRFSAGLPAIQLDSVCDFSSILIGPYPDYPVTETAYPWTYLAYSYYHGGDK